MLFFKTRLKTSNPLKLGRPSLTEGCVKYNIIRLCLTGRIILVAVYLPIVGNPTALIPGFPYVLTAPPSRPFRPRRVTLLITVSPVLLGDTQPPQKLTSRLCANDVIILVIFTLPPSHGRLPQTDR